MNEEKPKGFERKEGIEYILCEHLESGLMKTESNVIWIGDNKRVILCPVCNKLEMGNVLYSLSYFRGERQRRRDRMWKNVIGDVKKIFSARVKELDAEIKELEAEDELADGDS